MTNLKQEFFNSVKWDIGELNKKNVSKTFEGKVSSACLNKLTYRIRLNRYYEINEIFKR